jgi:hypothetical protein
MRALDEIASRLGMTRVEAARPAIAETAEARRLMQNPTYVAEARDVASLLEELRGPRVTSTRSSCQRAEGACSTASDSP